MTHPHRLLALTIYLGLVACSDSTSPPVENKQSSPPAANAPQVCGDGGTVVSDVVAVTGSVPVYLQPSLEAPQLKNEKASGIMGKEMFHSVDPSTSVRRLCDQGEWTQVQVVTPEWLTHVKGWVQSSAIRGIERSGDGKRVFVDADFSWREDTEAYKPQIIAAVNKISRENAQCEEIQPYSAGRSPTDSKPGDPVFFVTCKSGSSMFNVYFRPGDIEADKTFVARQPIGKAAAISACEVAARNAVNHPSTVNFSRIMDAAYAPHPSGRARVTSSFTAKNAFNLELKYNINCLFEGNELIETTISEAER